jgi:hypothetical protein
LYKCVYHSLGCHPVLQQEWLIGIVHELEVHSKQQLNSITQCWNTRMFTHHQTLGAWELGAILAVPLIHENVNQPGLWDQLLFYFCGHDSD